MSDLPSFLAWFEGYAENINGRPTQKQWDRVVTKIKAIRAPVMREEAPVTRSVAPAPSAALAQDQAPDPFAKPPPSEPATEEEWIAQYIEALVDLGLDEDSAKDDAVSRDADMRRSPQDVARETATRDYAL